MENTKLCNHFTLAEFCNWEKYSDRSTSGRSASADNIPPMQAVVNLTFGCLMLLEPARQAIGCPIIINSGFRSSRVNTLVGGVRTSQHLQGCAADIRPKDPAQFQRLISFLMVHEQTDQLLTGQGWLHISWTPFGQPRHYVRIGYYK